MNVNKRLKWVWTCVAAVSLTAMTALFVWPTAWVARWAGWLPSAQLVPAAVAGSVVTLTAIAASVALFGRLYCSVVCPLGLAQDFFRRCFGRLVPRRTFRPDARWVFGVRLAVLAAFVVGAFLGFTGLIAPYGVFGRFLSVCCGWGGKPAVVVLVWALGLFAFVMAMTFVRARWWCNRVCPVGTLLGLFSRFAVSRVRVDAAKCAKCGLCAKACDKGALTVGEDKTVVADPSVCTVCLACAGVCRKEALKWR